ncbi:MAG: hypothetical protein S4CHLAM6_12450 [Chlamydiae bacterium]|nr:hypothetical protein [Chlamydiota bacterium]
MLSDVSVSSVISDCKSKIKEVVGSQSFQVSLGAASAVTVICVISSASSNLNDPISPQSSTKDTALKADWYANQTTEQSHALLNVSSWSSSSFFDECLKAATPTSQTPVSDGKERVSQLNTSKGSLRSLFMDAVLPTCQKDSEDAYHKVANNVSEIFFSKKEDLFCPIKSTFSNVSIAPIKSKASANATFQKTAKKLTKMEPVETSYSSLYIRATGALVTLGSLAFLCRHQGDTPTVVVTGIAAGYTAAQSLYRNVKGRIKSLFASGGQAAASAAEFGSPSADAADSGDESHNAEIPSTPAPVEQTLRKVVAELTGSEDESPIAEIPSKPAEPTFMEQIRELADQSFDGGEFEESTVGVVDDPPGTFDEFAQDFRGSMPSAQSLDGAAAAQGGLNQAFRATADQVARDFKTAEKGVKISRQAGRNLLDTFKQMKRFVDGQGK